MIGTSGASYFNNLARPFVRVAIKPPGSEGGGGHFYEIPRTELINDLSSAIQGGTEKDPIEVKFDGAAGSAELMAEIKAAPDTEDHSDQLLSVAIALWHACKNRRRLERIDQPPPKVLLGYPKSKWRP